VRKGEPFIHTIDLKAERFLKEGDLQRRAIVDIGGACTLLAVPFLRDRAVLGAIQVYRTEVHPFTEKRIVLLQNFVAQAVIAMENARLLDEIRQREEELRITFDNMGGGVARVDETQHLVAWNGRFQKTFDLPDALLKQHRTYEEHPRFLAERGDFGTDADTTDQIHQLVTLRLRAHA
jgi:PAS domain-containing protein